MEVAPEVVPGKCPLLDRLYSKQLVVLCILREEQSQSTDFWLCFLSIGSPNLVYNKCNHMVSHTMKLYVAWKLQPIPLVVISESFDAGAGQAD